ncbi:hypothetical protein CF319_g8871 [Tilletia indica]|nr:hypothetical protein CF319_g8871 [Tilletia indica]
MRDHYVTARATLQGPLCKCPHLQCSDIYTVEHEIRNHLRVCPYPCLLDGDDKDPPPAATAPDSAPPVLSAPGPAPAAAAPGSGPTPAAAAPRPTPAAAAPGPKPTAAAAGPGASAVVGPPVDPARVSVRRVKVAGEWAYICAFVGVCSIMMLTAQNDFANQVQHFHSVAQSERDGCAAALVRNGCDQPVEVAVQACEGFRACVRQVDPPINTFDIFVDTLRNSFIKIVKTFGVSVVLLFNILSLASARHCLTFNWT